MRRDSPRAYTSPLYIQIGRLKLRTSRGVSSPPAEATEESDEFMSKRTPKKPSQGQANLEYLRNMSDEEIARTSPPELANLPADFWDSAKMVIPIPKEAISLRVDEDVLAWFRKQGPLYQSRMNAVLRSYVTAMTPSRKNGKAKKASKSRTKRIAAHSTVKPRTKSISGHRE